MKPFLYNRLIRALLAELASGTYEEGSRFLSKRKICHLWGVSEPTAKSGLRHLVDKGLIEPRPRSGYILCPGFQTNALLLLHRSSGSSLPPPNTWKEKRRKLLQEGAVACYRIGLIMEQNSGADRRLPADRFDAAALEASRAFFREATKAGCEVSYFYQNGTKQSEDFLCNEIREKQLDAVVFFRRFGIQSFRLFIERLVSPSLPVVTVFDDCEHSAGSSVNFNNVAAGYDAAQHLLQAGHRRIVVLVPARRIDNCEQRLEGFRLALKEHDAEWDAYLSVFRFRQNTRSCFQLHQLLTSGKERPTALFACAVSNFVFAKRTLNAEKKKISRRIQVVGCGSPKLLKKGERNLDLMALDFSTAGRTAFHHIKDILDGNPTDKATIIPAPYLSQTVS